MMKIIFIICILFLMTCPASADYVMPIGIPDPSDFFGTFDPIDTPAPVVNVDGTCTHCPNWPTSATTDCYYIDMGHSAAIDSGNTHGYPDLPRLTIPEGSVNAGTFMYITNGNYQASGDRFSWYGTGTPENPIWIVGDPNNKPVFMEKIHIGENAINTSYLIMENLDMRNIIEMRPYVENQQIDHIVVRNCLGNGTGTYPETNIVGVRLDGNDISNARTDYIVAYNNTFRDVGDWTNTAAQADYGAFAIQDNTSYFWVLNNTIFHYHGDGLGGGHTARKSSDHFLIGGNTIYECQENCVDIKEVDNIIISQNKCYNISRTSSASGEGIVVHYGAFSMHPNEAWIIFNEIYNCQKGISSTSIDNIYVMGNDIHDMIRDENSTSPEFPSAYAAAAAIHVGGSVSSHVIDNTITNCDYGIQILSDNGSVYGNIISNRTNTSGYEVNIDNSIDAFLNYNHYDYVGGEAILFGSDTARHLSWMQTNTLQSSNGSIGDPLYISSTDRNLQSDSPCINNNSRHDVYDTFFNTYGVSIEYDINGVSRPQDTLWDKGAYEYIPSGSPSTKFEYYDGSAWIEDTPPRMQYFRCYLWCTECANAEQSSTQHSLRITNNGTSAGIPKVKLNQNTPNTITMYMDDDYTYAGAIILNDTYQVVGPELAPGESVYLSSWVDLVNPSSWPFETYAIVE